MDILNYFGFEDFIRVAIDIGLFIGLLYVYLSIRNVHMDDKDLWAGPFKNFIRMALLSLFLPVVTGWLSFVILEDLAEEDAGIIFLLSFYPPLIAALYFVFVMSKNFKRNA